MQAIGLTGGIGSGKSTIARIFKQLGYPIYIADTEAGRLMNTHPLIRRQLEQHFGAAIYNTDNTLNKAKLADIIFEHPDSLQAVNQIVHPVVMEDFQIWSIKQKNNLVFFESAILFESNLASYFNKIICVTAPEEIRVQRVVQRDRTTPEKVKERIRNQIDDREKCKKSNFIIRNDENNPVIPQVLEIIKRLSQKAQTENRK